VNLIDGKKIAKKIEADLRKKVGTFSRPPGLAFVLVGNHPPSKTFVAMKKKKCLEIGIASKDKEFPDTVTEQELLLHIDKLNRDTEIDGILVQLPLPAHISVHRVMEKIAPEKDVDGFHPLNVGRMLIGETSGFLPCTPHGIQALLQAYRIPTEGKHVVILGRSNIVGKPLGAILMQKRAGANATVTIAHSQSHHLREITQSADILVAAIGKARFVTKEMVKPGAVVIDVGINRVGENIVGDVDFESVGPLCSYITPVPGGVGPMTIAMLMANTVLSYERYAC
jgi:methylenetetrahydrofolate dehydrogenase (NADP+)/methenyltetrahydrofolate cyclohydrolase